MATKKVSKKKTTATKKTSAKKASAKKPAATNKPPAKKTTATKKPAAKKSSTTKGVAPSPAEVAQKIEALIARTGDWRGQKLAELRRLIHEVAPDVVEEWKWMGTPVWSKNGMLVLANPHKDKVKLQFFHGAKIADPKKLFNAGLEGGTWRAIDFFEGVHVDERALRDLLKAAVVYNETNAVAKSKGSRAR